MSWLADWVTYFGYSIMWRTIRWLPEKKAYAFFEFLARRAYSRNGRRVERLRENYRMVRPGADSVEIERMVKAGLSHSMRYWCETFRISDWDRSRTISSVVTNRDALLFEGLARGSGVVIALPHAGNWDHAGLYFSSHGVTVHTVAEHLKPDRLFRRFLAHRQAMGLEVLDIEMQVMDQLQGILETGGLVALVADRDLSRSGIDVDFFGANARMPAGPALLAYRTGARLITAYVGFRESGISINFAGPIKVERSRPEREEVQRVTQLIANQFEADIELDPTSWHMLQRIFIAQGANRS